MEKTKTLEDELLEKMYDLFKEIIKKQKYYKVIKENKKGFYVSVYRIESEGLVKDINKFKDGDIYYLKLAHKTQEEYEERLKKEENNERNKNK